MRRKGIAYIFAAQALIVIALSVTAASGCSGSADTAAVATTPIPSDRYDFSSTTGSTETTSNTTGTNTAAAPAGPAVLDRILSAYDVSSHLDWIAELASDKYQGRRTGSAGARAAADYIAQNFAGLGLVPWQQISPGSYLDHFTAAGVGSDNVIGVLPGSGTDGSFLILGAHYDHLGVDSSGQAFNGADDNAAGVAALLETARILKQLGVTPKSTIVFCAFSGEEEGEYGAEALGSEITAAGLAGNVEMINIDGIGAIGGSYFGVWDEGTPAAAGLVSALKQAGAYLGTTVQEDGTDIGSDAQAFDWQYGIPAVTVDWSWGDDPGQFHPYYHTIYDDVSAIDPGVLAKASKVAIAGMWIRASE